MHLGCDAADGRPPASAAMAQAVAPATRG